MVLDDGRSVEVPLPPGWGYKGVTVARIGRLSVGAGASAWFQNVFVGADGATKVRAHSRHACHGGARP